MNPFQYPKNKFRRNLTPRLFKRYQTYKRYLQTEFSRVCVYCRQPDSSAPNLNYGVDHYRPKGISRFSKLVCEYTNLFYCCGNCNSRKNNYWPLDEKKGPYVVNPCDYEMASHLRFNSTSGKIETISEHGKHTEELLQLNEPASIKYRQGTLLTINIYLAEIKETKKQLIAVDKLLKKGEICLADYTLEVDEINKTLALLEETLQSFTGELPLQPLKKIKLGVILSV